MNLNFRFGRGEVQKKKKADDMRGRETIENLTG